MNTSAAITCAGVFGAVALAHIGVTTAAEVWQSNSFSRNAIETGVHYDKAECLALPHSVWTDVGNLGAEKNFCARYYIALGATRPREAIVYFDGDQGSIH